MSERQCKSKLGEFINGVFNIELADYQLKLIERLVENDGKKPVLIMSRTAGRATVRRIMREIYGELCQRVG